ncbi:MAG: CoA pyrophosphatase [Proteobacteria bacterium]|nr:CoA pyrophosphatase [Pseudomonadota bacterium]
MQCDSELKHRILENLGSFTVRAGNKQSLRQAAVAIVVTDVGFGADLPGLPEHTGWQDSAALLLTRRSEHLRNHPGQWAFPGGRIDPGETVIETALRELEEEVGIELTESSVMGRLDDFVTRSGFVMTPILIWGGPGLQVTPNPGEVASVHRIPLTEFLRPDAPDLMPLETGGQPVLRMPVGEDTIAAPTAALIYQFRELCLLGRHTRVAHFEQPEFAWR